MKNIFFSYNDFVEFNDDWRKHFKKPIQSRLLLAFYYPFALIIFGLLMFILEGIVQSVRNQPKHKNSNNYKKVIKKGLLWDTTYYIEK